MKSTRDKIAHIDVAIEQAEYALANAMWVKEAEDLKEHIHNLKAQRKLLVAKDLG